MRLMGTIGCEISNGHTHTHNQMHDPIHSLADIITAIAYVGLATVLHTSLVFATMQMRLPVGTHTPIICRTLLLVVTTKKVQTSNYSKMFFLTPLTKTVSIFSHTISRRKVKAPLITKSSFVLRLHPSWMLVTAC